MAACFPGCRPARDGTRLSAAEHTALLRIRQAIYSCSSCASATSTADLARVIAEKHSFIVTVRTGLPEGFYCLSHSFLLVQDVSGGPAIVVDLQFRDRFQYAALPDGSYSSCVAALPQLFIGTLQGVTSIVNAMCDALQREASARGHQLPPWRSREALFTNWLPARFTDDVVLPPGSSLHPVLLHTSHSAAPPRSATSQCSAVGPAIPRAGALSSQPGQLHEPVGPATVAVPLATSAPLSLPDNNRHDPEELKTPLDPAGAAAAAGAPVGDPRRLPTVAPAEAPWCVVVRGFSTPGGCGTGRTSTVSTEGGGQMAFNAAGVSPIDAEADTATNRDTTTSTTTATTTTTTSTSTSGRGSSGVSLGTALIPSEGCTGGTAAPGMLPLGAGAEEYCPEPRVARAPGSRTGSTDGRPNSQPDPPRSVRLKRVSSLTLSLAAARMSTLGAPSGHRPPSPTKGSQGGQQHQPKGSRVVRDPAAAATFCAVVPRAGAAKPLSRRVGARVGTDSCGAATAAARGLGAEAGTRSGSCCCKHPPSPPTGADVPALKHHKHQESCAGAAAVAPAPGKAEAAVPGCAGAAPPRAFAAPCVKWDAMPRIITVRPVGPPRLVKA